MAGESRTNPTVLPPTPEGWQEMQIEELCERVTSGGTPSRQRPEYYENGVFSWFKTKELKDCALYDSEERITQDALDSSSAKLFPPNTVLMAMYGDGITITSLGILRREAATNQACCAMIPKSAICEPRFLFYSLLNHREDFIRIASGGAQRNLSGNLIRRFALNVPPLAEQKAIAEVLGALDDKIELNRRMNETLEAMARALFQSWFVDFDPVRAKLDGRQPVGMDPATAKLFPDAFQDSALGPIPKDWTAARLPDAIDVNPRRILRSGVLAPYLDMKNLPTQGHSADEVVERTFSSGTKFQNGDTLLARITPCLENGKTGYVDFLEAGQVGWGSTEYIVFAPKPPLPPQFGYLLARSDTLRSHAIRNMTGTSGRQRVPSECFGSFWLAVPTPGVARRFDELTAPLMAKIKATSEESRTLATVRDALLPKLLSGELSVIH